MGSWQCLEQSSPEDPVVQAGAQEDRTSEYYDCPLRLLGSADDDALLQ